MQRYVEFASRKCRHTDVDGALSDHGAVGLVNDAIDLLEVVGVGDDLVTGEDILESQQLASFRWYKPVAAREKIMQSRRGLGSGGGAGDNAGSACAMGSCIVGRGQ